MEKKRHPETDEQNGGGHQQPTRALEPVIRSMGSSHHPYSGYISPSVLDLKERRWWRGFRLREERSHK
jgi:hypothetical protein